MFKYVPPARAIFLFDKGDLDIEASVNPSWRMDVKVKGIYSIPFDKAKDVIVFRSGQKVPVSSPESLKGQVVGTVRGYVYPYFETAFKDGVVIRRDNTTESLLLMQLLAGRFNQVLLDLRKLQYEQLKHPDYRSFEVGNCIGETDVMMRIHPQKKNIVQGINDGLKQMLDTGVMAAIYSKYQLKGHEVIANCN